MKSYWKCQGMAGACKQSLGRSAGCGSPALWFKWCDTAGALQAVNPAGWLLRNLKCLKSKHFLVVLPDRSHLEMRGSVLITFTAPVKKMPAHESAKWWAEGVKNIHQNFSCGSHLRRQCTHFSAIWTAWLSIINDRASAPCLVTFHCRITATTGNRCSARVPRFTFF